MNVARSSRRLRTVSAVLLVIGAVGASLAGCSNASTVDGTYVKVAETSGISSTWIDEVYDFAKLCLLDELDGAFVMLPIVVERDKIGGQELATWPLLAPLREDPRIRDYADMMRDYLSDEADNTIEHADSEARIGAPSGSATDDTSRASESTRDGSGEPPDSVD